MTRATSYREAIIEALTQEMTRDASVIVLGGGGISAPGLSVRFPGRVLGTAGSGSAFVGAAIGAATRGQRPVAELAFPGSGGIGLDQIFGQAAMFRSLLGGAANTPLVLRMAYGTGLCPYPIFTHLPGFKVVVPATPYDAKGLMVQAIRDEDPVIFCEHKALYDVVGEIPCDTYTLAFGDANVVRSGGDVTLVALGRMVPLAEQAARELAVSGIDAEVIDPRTTSPLDTATILGSVGRTGRLVVVDEASPRCNLATDISALVAKEAFGALRAPIEMVTPPHAPAPGPRVLENLCPPDTQRVVNAAKTVVGWRR
ncbi:alpha-ketoacid dehydrogenase subunit beta [Amycolatopsis sp. NPDC059027]|uniref:alpha-ketoacid dehydrogenase subunit beta n=1 Tax=unclassified Amycolatopsis TaxID=2618356 RepID=UPI00366AF05F